jgi:hypothetical protein
MRMYCELTVINYLGCNYPISDSVSTKLSDKCRQHSSTNYESLMGGARVTSL